MIKSNFPEDLSTRITKSGIVAVLVIDKPEDSEPLAEALLKGGVNIIELTLRTPSAIESVKRIVKGFPEMTVGIGTILFPEQVSEVKAAGAVFGLAPGMNPIVVKKTVEESFPFIPGIATASDIEAALGFGCRILKFFPAETGGGLKHLESMATPYAHLGLKFVPLGGLNQENFTDYLKSKFVTAIGGSWIAKREEISQHKWASITEKARIAVESINKMKK
ncbi:MAG TPA: bifunctional 4-hydroxy-2-oxoglutarate aldolase/2-dehydro-3-deoxy-phosphogluconate aldolase [Victivallales bacterium]|nr:bifunctional 4-hydroxy-2-oxoglutarate aldolase/2-dehydro-3-deoxy-phosphogluconate aldolase [Victivallales bacterium]